jgi:alkanesulfonate monooxygenase SsuD/methylene tetrahydromethanopterin reductase-like flavin-dependent oxidoreductase (luciferase family)
MENLPGEIELADQVGLDVFGVGEHHRSEFVDSAPVVILGAALAPTIFT